MTQQETDLEFSQSRMSAEEIVLTLGIWILGGVVGLALDSWLGVAISLSFFFAGNYFGRRLPPRLHGVSKSEWDRARELAEERKQRREAKRKYVHRVKRLHQTLSEHEEYLDKKKTYTGNDWVIVSKKASESNETGGNGD